MRTIILAALIAGAAGPALAQLNVMNTGQGNYRPNGATGNDRTVQSASQSTEQQFRKFDVHRNGLSTRGEWSAAGQSPRDFTVMDTTKDKRVDLNEYSLAMTGRPAEATSTASAR